MAFDPSMAGMGGGAGTAALSTKVDLNISLRNVPKMDLTSPSDPFVIISAKTDGGGYNKLANTEIVWDNQNPNFTKQITIDYRFEEVQHLRLDAYDADSETIGSDLRKHDYMGSALFVLGDLVTSEGQKLAVKLKGKDGQFVTYKGAPSVAIIRAQELSENRDEFKIQFACHDLPKPGLFGKAKRPYLEVSRQTPGGDWASMWRSDQPDFTKKGRYQYTFKPVNLSVRLMCNGDVDRPVMIRCYDQQPGKSPEFIGEVEVSLAMMMGETTFQLKNPREKKKKKLGSVLVVKQELVECHSFLQFITGGLDLNLMVAIDFTGSNGDPRSPTSLHYMGAPSYESDYLRVIKSVVRILESYDKDGRIPVYGFGANITPGTAVKTISHCFPLTFTEDAEVEGVQGVMQAYGNALRRVQLYGPTLFTEILQTARVMSSHKLSAGHLHWTILLIITDGIINDMDATIGEIVGASYDAALSIIIVGVGKGDAKSGFAAMERLDADEVALVAKTGTHSGKEMKADIVQFVEFEQFKGRHLGALASEVLREVPGQVEEHMSRKKMAPGRPVMSKKETMADLYAGPRGLAATKSAAMLPGMTDPPAAAAASSGPATWRGPGSGAPASGGYGGAPAGYGGAPMMGGGAPMMGAPAGGSGGAPMMGGGAPMMASPSPYGGGAAPAAYSGGGAPMMGGGAPMMGGGAPMMGGGAPMMGAPSGGGEGAPMMGAGGGYMGAPPASMTHSSSHASLPFNPYYQQ